MAISQPERHNLYPKKKKKDSLQPQKEEITNKGQTCHLCEQNTKHGFEGLLFCLFVCFLLKTPVSIIKLTSNTFGCPAILVQIRNFF